jgi:hypothetical protein
LRKELELLDRTIEKVYVLPEDLKLARIPNLQGLGGSSHSEEDTADSVLRAVGDDRCHDYPSEPPIICKYYVPRRVLYRRVAGHILVGFPGTRRNFKSP